MTRKLQARLDRLEEILQAQTRGPIRLCFIRPINVFGPVTLAENERIVWDVYRSSEGGRTDWARERITVDPSDHGRTCEPDRCLEDVLQEMGDKCDREADGSCGGCG